MDTTHNPHNKGGTIPQPFRLNRATTLRPRNGVYQCNTRIDPKTHERLEELKAYYSQLTELKANSGVVVRRALRLLRDHLETLEPIREKRIIEQCAEGRERPGRCCNMPDRSLNR